MFRMRLSSLRSWPNLSNISWPWDPLRPTYQASLLHRGGPDCNLPRDSLPESRYILHEAIGQMSSVQPIAGAILAEAEQSGPQAVRFRAFVSYSHADAAIAQKLHRQIETYRLPAHLRVDSGTGANDGRLGRIFRDREDLPAAGNLSATVKRALAESQVLVVICSPDARGSIWVAREIELFRALHPDRPILAALVRGEPQESFPALLLEDGAEPLAADLRKQGDGWRLGFLKMVAGIADVPLDALVQRDAARRIRRVMVVTGGALVALLAAGADLARDGRG